MEKKKMTDKYIIRDRIFDLNWASGLVGSFIPRKWTLQELLQLIRDEKMSNVDDLCRMNLKFDKETADMLEPYAVGKYKFNIKDKGEDK